MKKLILILFVIFGFYANSQTVKVTNDLAVGYTTKSGQIFINDTLLIDWLEARGFDSLIVSKIKFLDGTEQTTAGGGISSGIFDEDIEIISYNDATYRIVSDIPTTDNKRILEVNDTSTYLGVSGVGKGSWYPATSFINIYPVKPVSFDSQRDDSYGITFSDDRVSDDQLGSLTTKAVFNQQGFKYLEFDQSNWTDSSLVTKKYVDDNAGGSYTFSNGLTENAGTVTLGGTLTGDTKLTLDYGTSFNIGGSSPPVGGLGGSLTISQGNGVAGSTYSNIQTIFDVENQSVVTATATSGVNLFSEIATVSREVNLNNAGLVYAGDYSTSFVAGSLINKGYADATYGGGGGGTPAGNDGDIQINNLGVFGTFEDKLADYSMTWDGTEFALGNYNSLNATQYLIWHPSETTSGDLEIYGEAATGKYFDLYLNADYAYLETGNDNGDFSGVYTNTNNGGIWAKLEASEALGSNALNLDYTGAYLDNQLESASWTDNHLITKGFADVAYTPLSGAMQVAKAEVLYSNTAQTTVITLPVNAVIWNMAIDVKMSFNDSGTDLLSLGITGEPTRYKLGEDISVLGMNSSFLDNNLNPTYVPEEMSVLTNITFQYTGQNLDATQGQAFIYIHYTLYFK